MPSTVCARQGDGKKESARQFLADDGAGPSPATSGELDRTDSLELRNCEILKSAGTDCAYRLFVSKESWTAIAAQLAEETDNDNFKSVVGRRQGSAEKEYLDALHEVWEVMHGLQN